LGDFAQLPPIGDTPLYSTKDTRKKHALTVEGRRVFDSFNQSITLSRIFRQEGSDPEQIQFRDALMRLRTYETFESDYEMFSTRFWNNLTEPERIKFKNSLHLLPTRALVSEFRQLANLNQPVVKCLAKHNCTDAKKTSDEDAEGLEPEILLAEGARAMITRNLWTSKGLVNGAQCIIKKIWYHPQSDPKKDLPAVVFVKCDGYSGKYILVIISTEVLISF
jgi:ATP-dependent DNA helicase PIF1